MVAPARCAGQGLVTERKIVAAACVDDRAVRHRFGGDWAEVWAELGAPGCYAPSGG